MATAEYWADAPLERDNPYFGRRFPTLDSTIADDDPVRLFDEILGEVDWTDWEFEYPREVGQPPIHPRHVAGAILYGMYRSIRSSRKLEEACGYRSDFKWLVEFRVIDYSTFCKFRTRFRDPLKKLFAQIGRIAMSIGLIELGDVAFDGTRVKANNSRFATLTAKTLEGKLKELDELFEQIMNRLAAADADGMGSSTRLPDELADISDRRERVKDALAQANAADAARKKQGKDPEKNPAQVPTTDPDSCVMPNKEGGYAPNYTPVVTTDAKCGFIVDADVLNGPNEGSALLDSVDRITETFGQAPERVLTDAGNNAGQIIAGMEERGIEFYAPVESSQPQPDSPALRDDPRQPIPESEWDDLPRNKQGQLDRTCFIYDAEADLYICPMGHEMPFESHKTEDRGGETIQKRVYRCHECADCPLRAACVTKSNKHGRTTSRDPFTDARERTYARMTDPATRHVYRRRLPVAETPFGILKAVMGFRQFLLRGHEKVKTEWLWAVTSFNITKLVREIGKMRAEVSQTAAETAT